ncbi:ferric reductase [Cohnella suwonensis]|uniref:Ferric reductase n=1 Tax=Cohnella suwonensis TaxID=696072 RepID=A0ABW0LXY8_9BACL
MTDIVLELPTWTITRVAGLAAYYMLFVGVSLGILYGMPQLKGSSKKRFYYWHAKAQGAGMALAIVHILILAVDRFSPFTWGQLLVPFSYPEHRFAYGLGSLSFYCLLLVMLTTDFRMFLSNRIWLAIHMVGYPAFFLALAHGLVSGTDTARPIFLWSYVGTATALVAITFVRVGAEHRAGNRRKAVRTM